MNTSVASMEFLANALCLDFTNTVEWRSLSDGNTHNDFFSHISDVALWGVRAKLISANNARSFVKSMRASEASKLLQKSRAVREIIYVLFTAVGGGSSVEGNTAEAFSSLVAEFQQFRVLHVEDGVSSWKWRSEAGEINRILGEVVMSAAVLLDSNAGHRCKQCPGDECGWLFLDTSRNGVRRWCDMQDCGNRVKARRFYKHSTARIEKVRVSD